MNIIDVGYQSTHYYVLADKTPKLLIDAGWTGTLPKFQHQFQRMNLAMRDIKHVLVTHYHPDHAGLVQDLKEQGSTLIVIEHQVPAIPAMRQHVKPQDNYKEIDLKNTVVITLAESRSFLAKLDIAGQIIATPGHSDDSVTLVLDDGSAFTGDLTPPLMLSEDDTTSELAQSWQRLRDAGAKTIYAGHGPVWTLE